MINDQTYLKTTNCKIQTSLIVACGYGNIEIAKLLLDAGANMNALDVDMNTLLEISILANKTDLALYLIDQWADISILTTAQTNLLILAASNGNITIFDKLIKQGADPKAVNEQGISTLHAAARDGRLEIVKKLIEDHNLDINLTSIDGATALTFAANYGHVDIVSFFLRNGASIRQMSKDGLSVIDAAILGPVDILNIIEISKILLIAGARCTAKTVERITEKQKILYNSIVKLGNKIDAENTGDEEGSSESISVELMEEVNMALTLSNPDNPVTVNQVSLHEHNDALGADFIQTDGIIPTQVGESSLFGDVEGPH